MSLGSEVSGRNRPEEVIGISPDSGRSGRPSADVIITDPDKVRSLMGERFPMHNFRIDFDSYSGPASGY